MYARILARRIGNAIKEYIDISEIAYDGDKNTLVAGDGTYDPPRMLSEKSKQTVYNKTISADNNTLLNVPRVGTVIMYPTNNSAVAKLGNKWLLCDGKLIERSEYVELFNTISTTFGSGDGLTTFGIPDIDPGNNNLGYFIRAYE